MSPMAFFLSDDNISYCYHAGRVAGFTVRHAYFMRRTGEHWELGTWFRRGTIFKMYQIYGQKHETKEIVEFHNHLHAQKKKPAHSLPCEYCVSFDKQ